MKTLNNYSTNALTTAQRAILQEHVYDLPKKYGEAIYRLRATLFEEVYDYPGTGRFANPNSTGILQNDFISLPIPNPTKDVVSFNVNLTSETTLTVCDIYGKQVTLKKLNKGLTQFTFNLENYQSGVYFFAFKQGSKAIYNTKVVVIK